MIVRYGIFGVLIAASAATMSWTFMEWYLRGKPSVLGAISGAVAGLVAITPAAGFVLPGPALFIGLVAGAVCFWTATELKHFFSYDDSLDAFGVHGIAGIIGTLATGWFAFGPLSKGIAVGGAHLFSVQCLGVAVTILYCAGVSWVLLKITDLAVGLRVTREEEREGLDIVLHGEQIF